MRGRPLTPEQRLLIATLRRQGCAREDLAARFGISIEAVTRTVVKENRRTKASATASSG